jgi:hypothetical protein
MPSMNSVFVTIAPAMDALTSKWSLAEIFVESVQSAAVGFGMTPAFVGFRGKVLRHAGYRGSPTSFAASRSAPAHWAPV